MVYPEACGGVCQQQTKREKIPNESRRRKATLEALQDYVALESEDFEKRIQGNGVLNANIERPAYDVSDQVHPKFLAQGDCVLGGQGATGDSVKPKPVDQLGTEP